jgi:hypothetical protein
MKRGSQPKTQRFTNWLYTALGILYKTKEYVLKAINSSSYGANSFSTQMKYEPLTPLYNYT